MGDLPIDRVEPCPPFQIVGIDFTGAFNVKCDHHRTPKYAKAYAAIFICFVTRAVHIEIVPSLSTEHFLESLKCFISRRGKPSTIYSDNGTNFRGAERYLNLQDDEISKYAAERTIDWKFNPPYTPHRGGIWESAVKSAKRFLPVVTKDQNFTLGKLRVFLTEIEAILNSRPLIYRKTEDPTSEVLTPGHFLIGRNLTAVTEPSKQGTAKLSDQYNANRHRIREFWRCWSVDYINQLRCRSKWLKPQPNPESGQIVFFKEADSEPCKWPLARITKCILDKGNLVRTVEILVNNQRRIVPTNHIVPLPTEL